MNDCDRSCLPSLYAVRPFSANAKSKSSITGSRVPQLGHTFVVKVRRVARSAPHSLLFPMTLSCSVILTRSEPPTKPIVTFFLSSFNSSNISSDAVCGSFERSRHEKSLEAHLASGSECAIDIKQYKFLYGTACEVLRRHMLR